MTSPTMQSSRTRISPSVLKRRVAALGIDLAVMVLVLLVARRLLGPGLGSLALVGLFATAVFGVVEGEIGTSPGKALMDLRLVNERGRPPGTAFALIRLAAWAVDGLPCFGGLALALIWFTPNHQRVGDLVAGTHVVSTREEPEDTTPTVMPGPAPEHYSGNDLPTAQHFDPIWDAALEAYVQWDPVDKRWMKYDDVLGGWGPVDAT